MFAAGVFNRLAGSHHVECVCRDFFQFFGAGAVLRGCEKHFFHFFKTFIYVIAVVNAATSMCGIVTTD